MTTPCGRLPEAYWGEWHGKSGLICGLCGQGTVVPKPGDSLADLIKLVRAHQRSEVCG